MTGTYRIITADAFDALAELEPETYCAVLCDPPYGLTSGPPSADGKRPKAGFMGMKWDHGVPSKELWALALAALRPGAPLLAFGGSRTAHRLTSAIEDSGFEIRDQILYLHGMGFPKSHSLSRSIDKHLGSERPVLDEGTAIGHHRATNAVTTTARGYSAPGFKEGFRDAPATPEAAQWEGYGSALKPAYENITYARKPLDGTLAHNALTHGVGGLNIDGCRIGHVTVNGGNLAENPHLRAPQKHVNSTATLFARPDGVSAANPAGRWPANLLLDEAAAHALDEQAGERPSGAHSGSTRHGHRNNRVFGDASGYVPPKTEASTGGPSRFYYTAKVSQSERSQGLPDSIPNNHPCMKPLSLCVYLATLLLPPDTGRPRRLLVPFSGSGSEILGGLLAGWDEVVGIEMNPAYVAIAEHRIRHWTQPGVWEAYAAKKAPKRAVAAREAAE